MPNQKTYPPYPLAPSPRFLSLSKDEVEPLLASLQTAFLIPIPSRAVRQTIEASRERTIANPQHERESADAPPNVLQALWQALYHLAHQLGMFDTPTGEPVPYNPAIVASVYEHLLQHRHTETLLIDALLPPSGSVYDLNIVASELAASSAAVASIMTIIDQDYTIEQIKY